VAFVLANVNEVVRPVGENGEPFAGWPYIECDDLYRAILYGQGVVALNVNHCEHYWTQTQAVVRAKF
jgi:hypothetical protein